MRALSITLFIILTTVMLTAYGAAVFIPNSGQFNVTQNVSFNWSVGIVNITSNHTGLYVSIKNSTTGISPSYFSSSTYSVGDYSNYTSDAAVTCVGTAGSQGSKFIVQNSTWDYTNTTQSINTGEYEVLYLSPHMVCPPGKYNGSITVQNTSNSTDSINITGTFIVPLSEENTLNPSTKIGFFRGTTVSNSHSYYFWTNSTNNVTSITINLTGLSANNDLFLLDDQGNLLESSINTGTNSESIVYKALPSTPELWEIRIGNASSAYRGYLYFSTLNTSNQSLAFGNVGINQTYTTNLSLTNLVNSTFNNVAEGVEVFKSLSWSNLNTSSNFDLVIPSFTQKIQAEIIWNNETGKNSSDWNIYLYDANDVLVGSSTDNSSRAVGANTTVKEIITYSGTITTDNDGLWNLSVSNSSDTGSLNLFNLTVKVWFNSSEWISTNTSTMTFNKTGLPNETHEISLNLTVPDEDLLEGNYFANLQYTNGSGAVYIVPMSFHVAAGTLLVGGNLTNTTARWYDNIGINRTGGQVKQLTLSVNNTGSVPIYYSGLANGGLNLTTNKSKSLNFTVAWPSNPIMGNTNTSVTLNVTIDTDVTRNTQGIYRGWIAFNTSNDTLSSSSYPYKVHNVTIEINLSNQLFLNITSVTPGIVASPSSSNNNITITVVVKLANGSVISNTDVMNYTNFSGVTLRERNYTSYYVSGTSIRNADVTTCAGGICRINSTLPSNVKGGNFTVSMDVDYNMSGSILSSTGNYNSILTNATGVYVVSASGTDLGSMGESSIKYVKFYVTNVGPQHATSAQINFYKPSSCPITVTTHDNGCTTTESGATFTSTVKANSTQCWYRWKIVSSNVTSAKSCTGLQVRVLNHITYANATSLTLYITDTDAGSTSSSSGTSGSTCSSHSDCAWNYRCSGGRCTIVECTEDSKHIVDHVCVSYVEKVQAVEYNNISIKLGGSGTDTVMVKNMGDKTVRAKLDVLSVSGITYTVETSSYSLNNDCPLTPNSYCYFNVKFNVSNSTALGKQNLFYKAYITGEPDKNTVVPFFITVLATEERKTGISSLYTEYLGEVETILEKIKILRLAGVPEANISKVELLYNQTEIDLANAKTAIDNEDFAEAETLLSAVNSSITRITGMLSSMGADNIHSPLFGLSSTTWLIIVGAGAAVIIGGLIVYMLIPPKGYSSSFRDYTKKTNVKDKISESIKKMKPKKDNKYKYKYKP